LAQRVNQRLSQARVDDFRRDGAVVIRQLLNADELALLSEGIDLYLAQPRASSCRFSAGRSSQAIWSASTC